MTGWTGSPRWTVQLESQRGTRPAAGAATYSVTRTVAAIPSPRSMLVDLTNKDGVGPSAITAPSPLACNTGDGGTRSVR